VVVLSVTRERNFNTTDISGAVREVRTQRCYFQNDSRLFSVCVSVRQLYYRYNRPAHLSRSFGSRET